MNVMFSQALSHLRHEKGVSQRQAAQELGVSQALLSHYENGIREPGLAFVVRASADDLLGRSKQRELPAGPAAPRCDPALLLRSADAMSRFCATLCEDEPELGLLFRRLGSQLTKELGKT